MFGRVEVDNRFSNSWHASGQGGSLQSSLRWVQIQRLFPLTPVRFGSLFASNRNGNYQVYSMCSNGEEVVRLTDNLFTERYPRWSPDGRRIAFVSDRTGTPIICIIDRQGTSLSILDHAETAVDNALGSPFDWSPDGGKIAFIGVDRTTIRVVDLQTKEVQVLLEGKTGNGYAEITSVCWRSSDGAILFGWQDPASGLNHDVFLLDPATSEVTQITDDWDKPQFTLAPAASPDGTRTAVVRHLSEQPFCREIFILDSSGRESTRLSHTEDTMHLTPQWFPDGTRLVYAARTNGSCHVYSWSLTGDNSMHLTNGDWSDVDPHVYCFLNRVSKTSAD